MVSLKHLILLSFLFPLVTFANTKDTLIVSYGDHNAAPYAIEEGETLHSGIIKDIASEIADELDINISFFKTPRKRTERYLENDTVHLVLISNPVWLDNSDKLQWSETVFIERDIIVTRATNNQKYRKIEDLKGMIIGTIRGFSYPNLQPFFDKEYFIRYDVSNLQVNFIRLELDRIDALVDADVAINYHLLTNKNDKDFRVSPLVVSKHNIQAALSPNSPVSIHDFNKALNKLKEQGVIAAILKKYQVEE